MKIYIKNIPLEMIRIPAGTYWMGDNDSAENDEKPAHQVFFKEDYYLGKYPVTQELWEAVMEEAPDFCRFRGKKRPIENISWDIIQEEQGFLATLNKYCDQENLFNDGLRFQLPTEAQWECAARSGKQHIENMPFSGGAHLRELAWFENDSDGQTHSVELKLPNDWGFYSMTGNVWEWCLDNSFRAFTVEPYDGVKAHKGKNNEYRVVRGGSWGKSPRGCRVAYRNNSHPSGRWGYIGFRLARY